jgi:hypothetical protein
VEVEIFQPKESKSDQDEWSCRYEITGLEAGVLANSAYGVDSVQALLLALTQVGEQLSAFTEALDFRGTGDIGFPKIAVNGSNDSWFIQMPLPIVPKKLT